MLRIPSADLPNREQRYLDRKQAQIDEIPVFEHRVARAKKSWNGKSDARFSVIRDELDALTPGARRCHYCEDSAADEVEHIWPKALYPERAFVWANYLFSCGPCNGSYKRSRFPLRLADGSVVEPPTGGAALERGTALFIDPRTEDPMLFLDLELDTGVFLPRYDEGTLEHLRAELTEDVLGLNRDLLKQARRQAYQSYRDGLARYVSVKANGATEEELARRREHLESQHHPTIWHEMIRSRAFYPNLEEWFEGAPELLHG